MIDIDASDYSYRRLGRFVAFVCLTLMAAMAVAAGGVAADDPTVTFDDPGEIDETGSADLIITDVPDDTGVGAYEIEIDYDSSAVELEASATDRFEVETNDNDGGTLTVVGYTGESDETPGEVTLAELGVTGVDDGETDLRIEAVETLADVDGEAISHEHEDLTLEISGVDDDDDDTGNGGGQGGGGAVAADDDADVDDDDEPEETPDDDADDAATPDDDADADEPDTDDTDADDPADDETDTVPGFGVIAGIVSLLAAGALGAQRQRASGHSRQ